MSTLVGSVRAAAVGKTAVFVPSSSCKLPRASSSSCSAANVIDDRHLGIEAHTFESAQSVADVLLLAMQEMCDDHCKARVVRVDAGANEAGVLSHIFSTNEYTQTLRHTIDDASSASSRLLTSLANSLGSSII